jgi:hypothetical protein
MKFKKSQLYHVTIHPKRRHDSGDNVLILNVEKLQDNTEIVTLIVKNGVAGEEERYQKFLAFDWSLYEHDDDFFPKLEHDSIIQFTVIESIPDNSFGETLSCVNVNTGIIFEMNFEENW